MTPELQAQMKKAFSLESWVTIEGPIWTFQKPADHIKQQGLIMAIVLPVVMASSGSC
ncbi:MAG: hypothetical protein GY913_01555 [Proteobacteria bacterium]|nr:hypothetical protein [Pseudomonadota bacterium]MCP4915585.1 hypothetical protein [Pseudomonadota bacterium]